MRRAVATALCRRAAKGATALKRLDTARRLQYYEIACRHLVDSHDLGTLETKASHKALLIESESVNAAVQGVGR
jgi:hypothetical protein